MKNKIIGSLCLLLIALSAEAQTEKGSLLLGGSGSMSLSFYKNTSPVYRLNLNPNVGFFIANNFALGGVVDIEVNGNENSVEEYLGAGPFLRYYFDTKKPKIKPYLGGGFAVSQFFSQGRFGTGSSNVLFKANLSPGLAYFINENVALDAGLRFNYSKSFGVFGEAVYPSFNIGFQVHLRRDRKEEKEGS